MRLPIALVVAGLLAASCVARPDVSVTPSIVSPPSSASEGHSAPPSIQPSSAAPGFAESPVAEETPAPVLPADPSRRATVEAGGVRLSIVVQRNPMPAGQATWVTKTITNTADVPLVYFPCGEAMPVDATLPDGMRLGRDLRNEERTWKWFLLGWFDHPLIASEILFLPKGQDGSSSGCGDIGYVERLAPGAAIRERATWDGLRFRGLNPPPTSRIDLTGTFDFSRDLSGDQKQSLEVHLDAWVAGPTERVLDPAEAVDVAVRDPRLTAILATRQLRNANEGLVRYVAATHRYWVGILESGGLPVAQVHYVEVDARSGELLGFVERDWDYEVEGYP